MPGLESMPFGRMACQRLPGVTECRIENRVFRRDGRARSQAWTGSTSRRVYATGGGRLNAWRSLHCFEATHEPAREM